MRSRWLTLLPFIAAACDPCACINSCHREYRLQSDGVDASPNQALVRLSGIGESGMDCEMDDLPRALSEGRTTLLLETQGKQGVPETIVAKWLATIDPDAIEQSCADEQRFETLEDLIATDPPPGTRLCVTADVTARTACTQKGCGS